MAASVSGIASGIDSAALIKSMVSVASQPISRLQVKQSTNNAVSKKLTDIKTKLTALQTAAKAMDSRSEAMVNKATSSDDKLLTATSTGGASLGNFDIKIDTVAKAERTYSNKFDSSTDKNLFGTDDLTIQVGTGDVANIEITSDDTLESVAGKINKGNLGVTAGIVYDGSKYRLQVSSNKSGTDNAITFGGVGADNLGLSDLTNEFQPAQNAKIFIDDIEITSQTNSISSAIPGVTLNVVAKGDVKVQVDRDPEGLKTKVDAFVKAYNDVMTTMNSEFAYTGAQKSAGSLSGDSTLRSAQSDLRSIMSQDLSALASSFPSIGSLGVSIQRDGTLSVDSAKLTKAVNTDYEGVTNVFAGQGGLMTQLVDKIDPFVQADGAISTRIRNLSLNNRNITDQISRTQVRIDKYEEQLTRQYAALESLMGSLQSQSGQLAAILGS